METSAPASSSFQRFRRVLRVLAFVLALAVPLLFRLAPPNRNVSKWAFAGYYVALVVGYAMGLYAGYRVAGLFGPLRGVARALSFVAITALALEGVFGVLVEQGLHMRPPRAAEIYDTFFKGGKVTGKFVRHHFLSYALNPDGQYGFAAPGTREVNAEFGIRRLEPIRPREQVQWRALVLGGSTTEEAALWENMTWVSRVEKMVRDGYGTNFDVINGGVRGYTLLENIVHYETRLAHLSPDVVIMFVGLNDVHPRMFGTLQLDYSNYRRVPEPGAFDVPDVDPTLKDVRAYRFFFLVQHIDPAMAKGTELVASFPYPADAEWGPALARNPPDIYRADLLRFVRTLVADKKKVVLVAQHYFPRAPREEIFRKGVEQHNAINGEVAQELGGVFIAESGELGFWVQADVLDDCHFSHAGTKKMSELVFRHLVSDGVLPPKP